MKILLVEDEVRMADAIAQLLRQENYEVDICYDGDSGLEASLCNVYDIMIFDIMLPGKSGIEIVRECRREKITTPVLLLTAKSEIDDKVNGLDAGADDYLTKPFDIKELLARLRALTRRNVAEEDNSLEYGDLVLHQENFTLACRSTGEEIRLSDKEAHIMETLMSAGGKVVSRETLAIKVWGYESEAEYNNVEVYISFTRKKLVFLGTACQIKAVRGVGYELRSGNV